MSLIKYKLLQIEKLGLFKFLFKSFFYFIKKIFIPLEIIIFRLYNFFRSNKDTGILSSPYEVVYLPIDLIKNTVHPYQDNYIFWLNDNDGVNLDLPDISTVRKKRFIFNQMRVVGKIKDGDWDKKTYAINKLITYIVYEDLFLHKKKWNETIYKTFIETKIEEEVRYTHFENDIEIKKKIQNKYISRIQHWINLYNNIKKYGYKSQKDISSKNLSSAWNQYYLEGKNENEVEVGISRKGEVLFIDGRNRFFIAKLLGIKEIPVIINICHKDYIKLLKDKYNLTRITPKLLVSFIKNDN